LSPRWTDWRLTVSRKVALGQLVKFSQLVKSRLVNQLPIELQFSCEKLVAEAGRQFGNPGEAVTRRLVKTQDVERTSVCDLVKCKVSEFVKRL
jgi:hypothetical protein